MDKLTIQVSELREICKKYGDDLEDKLADKLLKPEDSRTACFPMVFNKATLTLELLSYYSKIWSKGRVVSEEERQRLIKENWERCNELSKMLFIGSMSSIEYSIKKSILLYPKHKLYKFYVKKQQNGFVSFGAIILNSKSFISDNEYEIWEFLRNIRNCTVHNNSIADRTLEIEIDNKKFKCEKNKMMQEKMDFYIFLTRIAIERYNGWINKFIDNNN